MKHFLAILFGLMLAVVLYWPYNLVALELVFAYVAIWALIILIKDFKQ